MLLSFFSVHAQDFQGQAFYFSKSTMELGSWGARMSEAQKKEVYARLQNRLEKTYILNFNKEASVFKEEEKLDAMSGATDSWGKNFARGEQYKNVKGNQLVQSQEFYGKLFLVKDELQAIKWEMGSESKQIGQYMCFKATATVPTNELTWFDFSWGRLRQNNANTADASGAEAAEPVVEMTKIEAWYTPQIPVAHGPAEYWGLPGLILEVSAGNTTMLCSKIVMNPEVKLKIEAPEKGKVITKAEYQVTVADKMQEMRDNRGRRRSR
ncbi:GLPGLI family protein [Robiginitalea sp.]|uniref:GLPGLI family protein n=1 Tax=Robiginitalea sp. TaxID=1902411 RepID=UPI003C753A2C